MGLRSFVPRVTAHRGSGWRAVEDSLGNVDGFRHPILLSTPYDADATFLAREGRAVEDSLGNVDGFRHLTLP
jgi:hypothetical protein